MATLNDVAVIIPCYNAERYLDELEPALVAQGIRPEQVIVVDSSSTDGTVARFLRFGAQVKRIAQADFNHGGTRRDAAELAASAPLLIYITQDAVPKPGAFLRLLEAFLDDEVGMAYGRQLPRPQARAIERHAREKNYPDGGIELRSFADGQRLGAKVAFCSNSFAAYRRSALISVGNFPQDAFFAEDQITAGKMLMQGWKLAYVGDACAVHSHHYSLLQEFRRYFDVGVFHGRNAWLLETFGRVEGEGLRFFISEIGYLWSREPSLIPQAFCRTVLKYLGYRIGRIEQHLPADWKSRLSMAPAYWKARRDH